MNDIQIDEPSWSELAERKRRLRKWRMVIALQALLAFFVGIVSVLLAAWLSHVVLH